MDRVLHAFADGSVVAKSFPAPHVWSLVHRQRCSLVWVAGILSDFATLAVRQHQQAARR
jgi:hypothetical protein